MKNNWKFWITGLLVLGIFLAGCDDDDDDASTDMEKVYSLNALNNSGVSGTVTFRKAGADATTVIIQLSGTQDGNSHPAHIHSGMASAGGPIVVDLTAVDGSTGRSETTVSELNDGTAITYEGLINYNGHVNGHESASALQVMIAQGDIGANSASVTPGDGDGGY